VTSKDVLKGQWFSPNLDTATIRLQSATSTRSVGGRHVVDGVRLVIASYRKFRGGFGSSVRL
jgi:hypothetical protein